MERRFKTSKYSKVSINSFCKTSLDRVFLYIFWYIYLGKRYNLFHFSPFVSYSTKSKYLCTYVPSTYVTLYEKRSTFLNVWRQSSGTFCTWTLTSNIIKSTISYRTSHIYQQGKINLALRSVSTKRVRLIDGSVGNTRFKQKIREKWGRVVGQRYPVYQFFSYLYCCLLKSSENCIRIKLFKKLKLIKITFCPFIFVSRIDSWSNQRFPQKWLNRADDKMKWKHSFLFPDKSP